MTKGLKIRIITSAILFLIAIFCVFVHPYIFMIAILTISSLSWNETRMIILNIDKKKVDNFQHLIFNLISFLYFFVIFGISAISLYLLNGSFFFFYILSICVCSDIGGYTVGKIVGGKKLTKISPNKTISGVLGSFCFSIIPLLIFSNFNSLELLPSINNFLFCLEASFFCQSGDLFISYLKRKAKVKDSGNILPGHGGLLDRIDGIIFVLPIVFVHIVGFKNYFGIWTETILYIISIL